MTVAINGGRTLPDEAKQEFAYELALGYFNDEELRRKFKLIPTSFEMYKASDEIALLVQSEKRKIDESDVALKLMARRAAREVLESNIKILRDPDAPAKTRMAAGQQIRDFAEGVDKAALRDPENTGGAVIIHTNLNMEGAKGVYTVTAREIDEQQAENREIANAAAAEIKPEHIQRRERDAAILELIGE